MIYIHTTLTKSILLSKGQTKRSNIFKHYYLTTFD